MLLRSPNSRSLLVVNLAMIYSTIRQETCYFCSTVAKKTEVRDAVDGKPLCNDCQVFFSDPSPIVLDLQQLETTAPYSYIHLKQHLG